MPTFIKADDDTVHLLDHVIGKYHRDLLDAAVRIGVVMAIAKVDKNGDRVGHALKLHGIPCFATIRITKHKERVQGMADIEISVDGDRWTFLSIDERVAILDHELTHLELVPDDETGKAKCDDGGRPKFRMRHHDYDFGWFTEVADRHGKASQEVQQARTMMEASGQIYWADFFKDANASAGTERARHAVPAPKAVAASRAR